MTFQETVSAITPAQAKDFLQSLPPMLHISMRDPHNCLGARLIKQLTGEGVSVGCETGTRFSGNERFEVPVWLSHIIRTALDHPDWHSRHTAAELLSLLALQEAAALPTLILLTEPATLQPVG